MWRNRLQKRFRLLRDRFWLLRKGYRKIDYIKYWPDLLGLSLLILGLMGEIPGPIPYPPIPYWMIKLHQDLSNDLISIGFTVLIIDNANKLLATRQEKKRLILQMGSPAEGFAIEAVRQLRSRGWLVDGSLRSADLRGADLGEAELGDADLSQANLHGAYLDEANLAQADLSWAFLGEAHLSRAELCEANLSNAHLGEADLFGADLYGANLSGADLSGANLEKANLMDTYLGGAYLGKADLRGAILTAANGLTKDQINSVESLDGATMPDGTKYKPLDQGPGKTGDISPDENERSL